MLRGEHIIFNKKYRFMFLKRFIFGLVGAFILIACGTSNRYVMGTTSDLPAIMDSIGRADAILIPDTSMWRTAWYQSNMGAYWEKYIIINGVDKRHIMTIEPCDDGKISYEYRVEKK